jgi:HD-like signal output (HDOD) protein
VQKAESPTGLIDRLDSIPPLPATAAKLMQMASDPDVEIDALAALIERDPPLSARMLGVANSAFYAPRRPVLNIKQAIVGVLGLNMVRNMAVGMAVTGRLDVGACPAFDLERYWVLALGTADLAGGLARAASVADAPDPDAAYLTALLHNIGELVMAYLWPEQTDAAIARAAADPGLAAWAHEREVVGIDRWEAGARLARHWGLPPLLAECIEAYPAPGEPQGQVGATLRLVRSARAWLEGVMVGREEVLRVAGVDDTYCEYRSTGFLERYEALRTLARSMH